MNNHKSNSIQPFEKATGSIDYTLTNDFMFHVVFEESDDRVLKKLLCSFLHIQPEEIISLDIRNPIDYRIMTCSMTSLNSIQHITSEMTSPVANILAISASLC